LYVAKNLKGEPRSGVVEAKDEHELARILREEGYLLVSFHAEEEKKPSFNFYIPIFSRVSLVEKIMFIRNLRVMVNAGVSLPRALGILVDQVKNKKFKKIIGRIKEKVVHGKSFSEALAEYPSVFDNLFVNMVKVGEESGTLGDVLQVLGRQMEREHKIVSKVKGAMVYPAVILALMAIIGILMMIMVVPKLSKIFSDLNIELPITTRIIIFFSNFVVDFWYILIIAFIALWFLLRRFLKTEKGRKIKDAALLKMPIISPIIVKTNSARTVRTLSSLIEAGVPIARSLEITSKTLNNIYYQEALSRASQEIKGGSELAEILKKYNDIYPSLVIQMIKVGEETGDTSEILKQLADFYEDEVSNITKNLSSVIEPVLMIIIGAAVGFFAVSIIQPIYGIVQGF
ncbi:MAG TPA: type II secretion system F family protein, partial [Candidatus Parcubacteria bacterium]|nr:type II secretion system F family protein [Candidatus Parcubacteria bacterium]